MSKKGSKLAPYTIRYNEISNLNLDSLDVYERLAVWCQISRIEENGNFFVDFEKLPNSRQTANCSNSILFITLMATSMSSPRMSLVLMIMMTARCPCCSHHQEPPTSRVLCSASPHRLSTAQLPGPGTVSTNPPLTVAVALLGSTVFDKNIK